jgi:hypothetical protein
VHLGEEHPPLPVFIQSPACGLAVALGQHLLLACHVKLVQQASLSYGTWHMCSCWCSFLPHRTVPFVAKAVGHPIAKYASLLMAGQTLKDIGLTEVCMCDASLFV